MEGIRQYLLTLTAAAVICAIANVLLGKKGAGTAVIKLLSGLFLSLSVISPWVKLDKFDFQIFTDNITDGASEAVSFGEIMASNTIDEIIIDQTRAYILDKATSMGLGIEVEVMLDQEDISKPCAVVIKGDVSPYARELLSQYIADNLSISKEDQHWS